MHSGSHVRPAKIIFFPLVLRSKGSFLPPGFVLTVLGYDCMDGERGLRGWVKKGCPLIPLNGITFYGGHKDPPNPPRWRGKS